MTLFDRTYWVRTLLATAVISAGVVGAMRFANAVPGGETRPSLSFAGTLTGTTGGQMLTFAFKRGGMTVCSPRVSVTPGPTGAFNVEVPLTGCPASLFDGSDVVFDVTVGSTIVARDQAVNPVPYARYADRVGTPDCPTGYERDATATSIVLCRKGNDEVVRVGSGASAFWIDRYEASVWSDPEGRGTQFGAGRDDYPETFPDNGQVRQSQFLFALSRASVAPSTNVTWFQAHVACRAGGKRLPTNEEWQYAMMGTEDPGASTGAGGQCVTTAPGARETGRGLGCVSRWGAQDGIGNVQEYVADWYAAPLLSDLGPPEQPAPRWGTAYGSDFAHWIASVSVLPSTERSRLPSAMARGGWYNDGSGAGVFSVSLAASPAFSVHVLGFRCVIPR